MLKQTLKHTTIGQRRQKGYTLIELGIAIAILAVLTVAGLSGVQSIMNSSKVSEQVKVFGRLQTRITANYLGGSTATATQSEVANLGGWDGNRVNAGVVTSAFGTTETLVTNAAVIGTLPMNRGFTYTIQNVPQAACPELAQGLAPMAYALWINTAITVPTSWTTAADSLVKAADAQVWTPAGIAKACATGNPLTFNVGIKP
jgi:prepilin-type N-terminal cleavage/methylation domain-containing protein